MFQGIDPKPNVRLEKAIDNKVSGSLTILLVTIFCIGSGAEISTIAQILLQDKYKKKNLNSNKREKKNSQPFSFIFFKTMYIFCCKNNTTRSKRSSKFIYLVFFVNNRVSRDCFRKLDVPSNLSERLKISN